MEISQAAKRLVCAFRIAFRAARILATDPSLPKVLRILFVIGLVQVPCLPTDEIAMAIALAWLLVFHRPALARAMREARSSETIREHTMSVRTRIAAAAAVVAALAAVVSIALGAVPAFASVAHRPCQSGLRVVQLAARQTGMSIGTDRLPFQGATPAHVAAELRRGAAGQGEPMRGYMLSAAGVAADLAAHERHGFAGNGGAVVDGWFMQEIEFAAASCPVPVRPF